MAVLQKYDWLMAIISIFFCVSSFGNGANDVANSYATSVAARTLTMKQVGVISMFTEFIGAVALGARVTGTIKNSIIDINRFRPNPSIIILVMTCAEVGSATWLVVATKAGFPVSTTQTVVGALVGAGIASKAKVAWAWRSGSVSQIAASWAIAPLISAAFSAILFGTLKYSVLERSDPLKNAFIAIPFYLAFTCAILALFLILEIPTAGSFEEIGAGPMAGIVLGVFFGILLLAYVFFIPYFKRRILQGDTRLRIWHVPLGPLLLRENPPLYFPAKKNYVVKDFYEGSHEEEQARIDAEDAETGAVKSEGKTSALEGDSGSDTKAAAPTRRQHIVPPTPEQNYLEPYKHLSQFNPRRIWGRLKWVFFQSVERDCVTHGDESVHKAHALARRYDNRVEHLWTYAQVLSAMIMSVAHGSNDVANAVGPWAAAYQTFQSGTITSRSETPVWILVIAGFLLGAGFWFFGHHIIRALGNKITQLSPTRGFSMELGSAITVLMASRLGLPISTTQCLTGSVMGVALMNYDLGAVNWKQLGYILVGWILTLPIAGLMSGILVGMSLNTPHF